MLAFVEAFWIMGVVFLLMLPFLPLLQYRPHKRQASIPPKPPDGLAEKRVEEASLPEPEEYEEEPHLLAH